MNTSTSFSSLISLEDKKETSIFFQKADGILMEALTKSKSKLINKIDEKGFIKKEFISDVYIKEKFENDTYKRAVVDLVQQGGGMFGIALLGYTYIMEKLGVRFYSHGGTSAGGINALLMASIPDSIYDEKSPFSKSEGESHQMLKSEYLTNIIANTDFSSFLDRKGFVGWLQEKALKNLKLVKNLLVIFTVMILLLIYGFFGKIFSVSNGVSGSELRFYDFVTAVVSTLGVVVFLYILLVKILQDDFGINAGNIFYNWADNVLRDVGVNTTRDLEKNMKDVNLVSERPSMPKLVLISSDLTHNKIVKFPEEASDYWNNNLNVKPVAYLRATMSVPFIFKVFVPSLSDYHNVEDNKKNYIKLFARFVDGGMLSNFPIREFHTPKGVKPRFPTFGVLLSEREKISKEFKKESSRDISLLKFVFSFIATFRNFYDNDFLNRSDEISMRIVTVNTRKFNWLNFWMSKKSKEELFEEGAKKAIKQLEKFNWEEYKKIRSEL